MIKNKKKEFFFSAKTIFPKLSISLTDILAGIYDLLKEDKILVLFLSFRGYLRKERFEEFARYLRSRSTWKPIHLATSTRLEFSTTFHKSRTGRSATTTTEEVRNVSRTFAHVQKGRLTFMIASEGSPERRRSFAKPSPPSTRLRHMKTSSVWQTSFRCPSRCLSTRPRH